MELDYKSGLYVSSAIEVPSLEGRGTDDAQAFATALAVGHLVIVEELDDLGPNGHVQIRLHSRDAEAVTKAVDFVKNHNAPESDS